MPRSKITLEHVRRNEARIVCKGGYFQAEWSPPWTQLRIPDAPQRKDDKEAALRKMSPRLFADVD